MAIWTVGTGMTYATISAAIAAGGTVNGDVIECYATPGNVYAETVGINKCLQVVGMVENQGLTIAGVVNGVDFTVANGSSLVNFVVRGSGGASRAVNLAIGGSTLMRVIATNASVGIQFATTNLFVSNCIAYSCGNAGIYSVVNIVCNPIHCGSFKNVLGSAWDFRSVTVGNLRPMGCLGAGGGTNFSNGAVSTGGWNVSADLTAPGLGSVTGFNTADFVNWAGNDFRISQAARLTTLARVPGYPFRPVGMSRRRRPTRERVSYAGPYYCYEQPTWGIGELSGVA